MSKLDLFQEEIRLEQEMTQSAVDKYNRELLKLKQKGNFAMSKTADVIISNLLEPMVEAVKKYLDDYKNSESVKSVIAAEVISRLENPESAALITLKEIFNGIYLNKNLYEIKINIGNSLEDEYRLIKYKEYNKPYYKQVKDNLKKRGSKQARTSYIIRRMYSKKFQIEIDNWTRTEKMYAALVLLELFLSITDIVKHEKHYNSRNHKWVHSLIPTPELEDSVREITNKLAKLHPDLYPMIVKPKKWVNIYDGGYLSPYIKKQKLIKQNSKEYLKRVNESDLSKVLSAVNHLQSTEWRINERILEVVTAVWEQGAAIGGLPSREDMPLPPFPYPELPRGEPRTEEQKAVIKKWKNETYDIHKKNVQQRSVRILTQDIINIAQKYRKYASIYFPYQLDFRGRMYPIPVLLNPQGSDLAKGLLCFAEGKPLGKDGLDWLKIHGSNLWGYDKVSYKERVKFIDENIDKIKSYANNPLDDTGWTNADKPIQFLAFCMEFDNYLSNPDTFVSYLPIQLDGTCNGLQHYAALLKDRKQGKSVNLVNSDKPNDIYSVVAENLINKLQTVNELYAAKWLSLGITRKLTKRPVMVLPYGGTLMSTRKYIQEYLEENYATKYIAEHFNIKDYKDCMFQVSNWLSKYLWEAIKETVPAAIQGMSYIKSIVKLVKRKPLRWITPCNLLIQQNYIRDNSKWITTELYGKVRKVKIKEEGNNTDTRKQTDGICPNFVHSLDAACLMIYLNKCIEKGIYNFMTVHDSYGTYACYTTESAKLLREAFVEVYKRPILDDFTCDVLTESGYEKNFPESPCIGTLDINEVLKSDYFFN